jgi:hypothetical protein
MHIDDLKKLADGHPLKYYTSPNSPQLQAVFGGLFGSYQVTMTVQSEGDFLQFRTQAYLTCPPDHPWLKEVFRTLVHMNCQKRMTKFGWDPSDGEIMAFADVWVMDGALTQKQFDRIVGGLIPAIDVGFARLGKIMATGEDPQDEGVMLAASGAGSGMMTSIADKIQDLLRKGKPGETKPARITEI